MIELASILAAYAAFALVHAAKPGRLPEPFASRLADVGAWPPASRSVALALAGLSWWLWSLTETAIAGALAAGSALLTAGSAFALLAPVWPRAVWGLALLSPPLVVVLALAGGM